MARSFLLGLGLLVVCGAPRSQSSIRGRTSVTVLDRSRKPWKSARVTLVSNVFVSDARDVDRVAAVTDDRGRARVELLRGRRYDAWVVEPDGEFYRATAVGDSVVAGSNIELTEAGKVFRPLLRISGLAAWKAHAPLRVVCQTRGTNLDLGDMFEEHALDVDAGGNVRCPMLPLRGVSARATILVVADSGALLLSRSIALWPEQPGIVRPRQVNLLVPPPLDCVVRVRGPDGPVAGATVGRWFAGRLYPNGVTDKDGMARVEIAQTVRNSKHGRRVSYTWQVRAPTLAETQQHSSMYVRGEAPEFTIGVERGFTLRGRLLSGPDTPAAGMRLALATAVVKKSKAYHLREPLRFTTAADGRFEITTLNRRFAWRLLAVPKPRQLASLAASSRFPTAPVAWLAHGTTRGRASEDLGDIRLDELQAIDLQVRSHDGRPADRARVLLGEPGRDSRGVNNVYHPVLLLTDRRGRLRLLTHTGTRPAIATSWRGGRSYLPELRLRSGQAGEFEIRLDRSIPITGTVMGPDGSVTGASLRAYLQRWKNSDHPHLLNRLPRNWTARTGPLGKFTVWVPADSSIRMTCRHRTPETDRSFQLYGSTKLQVQDEPPKPVQLTLAQTRTRKF